MQVVLDIPENRLAFFMELVNSLGFVNSTEKAERNPLTRHQMDLVDIEVQKAKDDPNYMLDWEEVKHRIDWDAC
ncbi:hypothetical protein F0919_17275 [Taibaiella lutea]|uniref:Addiction module protein n=1 Tax=Taibaiella lutea TaxID=2608001 RepID=A0A5M6CGH5_9BACT|nr:hypothetical protein [Taibaiella lutea]KAA5532535.1 hypothetical protein F0919_17275 [Taibaiella lutea]